MVILSEKDKIINHLNKRNFLKLRIHEVLKEHYTIDLNMKVVNYARKSPSRILTQRRPLLIDICNRLDLLYSPLCTILLNECITEAGVLTICCNGRYYYINIVANNKVLNTADSTPPGTAINTEI